MIYVILGTKAQLIKMAPIMRVLTAQGIAYRFISTGQHRDTMSDILDNFAIKPPDYQLYTGKDITSIPTMVLWAVRILWYSLRHRSEIFGNNRMGIVLVHGDTFSTLLGALMGRFGGMKVAHVESGLRSFDIFHPFPEEITRLITFRLAHYLFCPGPWAVANLQNYTGEKIDTRENTLSDSLRLAVAGVRKAVVELPNHPFAVVTLHRFENIYSKRTLERVIDIVERVATEKSLVFIMHKPTEKRLRAFNLYTKLSSSSNIELRRRYDYFQFIRLISAADFVISDGGSNQEECYYLGKPVLLLRNSTERHEGLGENCVLSHYDSGIISQFLANWESYQRSPSQTEESASEVIVRYCVDYLGQQVTK